MTFRNNRKCSLFLRRGHRGIETALINQTCSFWFPLFFLLLLRLLFVRFIRSVTVTVNWKLQALCVTEIGLDSVWLAMCSNQNGTQRKLLLLFFLSVCHVFMTRWKNASCFVFAGKRATVLGVCFLSENTDHDLLFFCPFSFSFY